MDSTSRMAPSNWSVIGCMDFRFSPGHDANVPHNRYSLDLLQTFIWIINAFSGWGWRIIAVSCLKYMTNIILTIYFMIIIM